MIVSLFFLLSFNREISLPILASLFLYFLIFNDEKIRYSFLSNGPLYVMYML